METAQPNPDTKISPQDLALLKRWNGAVEKKRKNMESPLKEWRTWREYARGKQHLVNGQRDPEEIRTNLILGVIQTLVPLYYAKDPEIDIKPTERLEEDEYPAIRKFCDTLRLVLSSEFIKRGKLKARMTRAIPSALTAPCAWFKVTYQKEWGQDPVIIGRLADAQDNLAELERLIRSVEKGDPDAESKKAEIQAQIQTLEKQVDVVLQEGLVIDRALCEEVLVLDETIQCFSDYPEAKQIAHLIPMTVEDHEARFGKKPTGSKFGASDVGREGDKDKKEQYVLVCELWSKQHSTVYTFCLGGSEWSREPYQPDSLGERWYPFFALYFNDLDGEEWPIPDVSQWAGLQDEYIAMRTQLAQTRKDNTPGFVFRKGGTITDEDIENLANRRGRRFIGIDGSGAQGPLSDDLMPFPTFNLNPAVYDPTPIVRDLEQAAGTSDASRQMIVSGKTATEAEIAAQGMASRTSLRVDFIEELIEAMAIYAAQILMQRLTPEQVTKIVGQGAAWPSQSREEIFDMFELEIVAGSTGKPNQRKDQETWIKLAPELVNTIQQAAALRAQGAVKEAAALMAVFKETLRRFDQRIDLSEFIGEELEGEQGEPQEGAEPPEGQEAMQPPPPPDPAVLAEQQRQLELEKQQKELAHKETLHSRELEHKTKLKDLELRAQRGEMFPDEEEKVNAEQMALMNQNFQAMQEAIMQMSQANQQAMASLSASLQEMARISAAPRAPVYGPDGRVILSVPQLGAN